MADSIQFRPLSAREVQVGPPTTLTRRMVSLLPMVVGLAILFGGPKRFVTPSFEVPRQFAPWWCWSMAFILGGSWMMWRSWQSSEGVFWSAFTCAVMFGLWAVGLGLSLFFGPNHGAVPATGFAVYTWSSACLAAVAARDPNEKKLFRKRVKK